jgi:hypothetical protein
MRSPDVVHRDIITLIDHLLREIHDFRNDGYITRDCKYQLYRVKCYLDDQYQSLPAHAGEEDWEKERIVEILKK